MTMTINIARTILVGALVGIATTLLFLFAIIAAVTPARAQQAHCTSWAYRQVCNAEGWPCYTRRYCRYWGYVESYQRRYSAAPRYDYDERDSRHCKETRKAVGDQHLTVDGAKKAATDAWAGLIRFHYGEKFIDLANARHISYLCSRSSIKEGGVTTLGQTLNRCELTATPCSPLREQQDER